MEYAHARIIKVLEKDDRKTRVVTLERNDGLFEFRIYVERNDDGPYHSGPYWAPTLNSGLYATAGEAEREALDQV